MHDTLHYMEQDPVYRKWHHNEMTFGLLYAFSENFILPLSHDEVVHGKGSLIGKMPGDDWQKFANLRAYFGFMWAHPGKKLLFMGGEIAQWREWNHDRELDWQLLDDPRPSPASSGWCATSIALYAEERALHEYDADPAGFRWVIGDDRDKLGVRVPALRRRRDTADPGGVQHDARAATMAIASACRSRAGGANG